MRPTAPITGKKRIFPRSSRRFVACALVSLTAAFFDPSAIAADDPSEPRTTFGTLGLVEMPSARMAPDGELSAGASYFLDTQRYDLDFQALPWLEVSLRYSGLRNFEPAAPAFYEVYWDRSFAAKARLFQETSWSPEITVGVNDLIGTGVYSGEYLVATKRLGDFDATMGLGWGRLAGTENLPNPLGSLAPSFKTRLGLAVAGGTDFNTLFRGPKSGLFGGVTWHTPVSGLSLSAEYSSDNYQLETDLHQFSPLQQFNYGVSYQLTDSIALGLDWLYGRSIGGSITFATSPTTSQYPAKIAPAPVPAAHIRTPEEQQEGINALLGKIPATRQAATQAPNLDKNAFVDRLFSTASFDDVEIRAGTLVLTTDDRKVSQTCSEMIDLVQAYNAGVQRIVFESGKTRQSARCEVPSKRRVQASTIADRGIRAPDNGDDPAAIAKIRTDAAGQDISVEALRLTGGEAIVYYRNFRYRAEDDALNRLILVLMADAPARIEKFRIFAMNQQEFDVLRAPMERAYTQHSNAELLDNAITVSRPPMDNPVLTAAARTFYPSFSWELFPQFRQSFFDPNNPLAVQLIAAATGTAEILPGLKANAEIETSIFQNFPDRTSDSLLPHVRSDLPEYIHKGSTGIGQLDIDYQFRLAPDLFAAARAGYLESMFAGAGGEVLWWPDRLRWAFGADIYEVKQRDFNRLFGLQDYRVTTGHISLYYQSPWYGLNFTVRAGQYLAGDRGITFQATRRFSTGVEIGAYFTKTNVSATQFGEGSFDKGILIKIPLDWALPVETQGEFDLNLRPVQRDGGQTLIGDATLYDNLSRTGEGEIDAHAESFSAP